MSWTDERVELLKQLWADGQSAGQIAAELGGVTRNGVIGKVHRLGLAGRAKRDTDYGVKRERKPRTDRPGRIKAIATKAEETAAQKRYAKAEAATEPSPEIIENIAPAPQRRTLLELNDDTCRWPIGDPATPEFFFCGAKPLTGLPYCNYHSRVAYAPAERRTVRPFHDKKVA